MAECERESAVLRSECKALRSRLDESQLALEHKVKFGMRFYSVRLKSGPKVA